MGARLAVAALMALLIAGAAPTASAHEEIVDTTPDNAATLKRPPSEVVIEFATAPESGTARVTGPNQEGNLAKRAVVRGKKLVVPLRSAHTPGRYDVRFSVLAGDGHRVSGSLAFEVTPRSAEPTPTPEGSGPASQAGGGAASTSEPETSGSGSSSTPLLIGVGGLIGVAGVGLAWWLARRRGASS